MQHYCLIPPIPLGVEKKMCSVYSDDLRRQCEDRNQKKINGNITHNHCPPRDEWGHKMRKKKDKTVRISFVNVNGIGSYRGHAKSEGIRSYIKEQEVDVMGLAETNVNWGKVRAKDSIWDRTKMWAQNRRIGVSYNTTQKINTTVQQGGTVTVAVQDMAHRVKQCGYDKSGLGRWS